MNTDNNQPLTGLNPQYGTDPMVTVLKLGNQNMSQLITQIIKRFGAQSAQLAKLGISNATSSGTQVVIGNGYLISISVTVASSGTGITGTVYDSNTITGVGSSVAIGIIPSSGTITFNWPYSSGLVIRTGSSNQTVSVSYV